MGISAGQNSCKVNIVVHVLLLFIFFTSLYLGYLGFFFMWMQTLMTYGDVLLWAFFIAGILSVCNMAGLTLFGMYQRKEGCFANFGIGGVSEGKNIDAGGNTV